MFLPSGFGWGLLDVKMSILSSRYFNLFAVLVRQFLRLELHAWILNFGVFFVTYFDLSMCNDGSVMCVNLESLILVLKCIF